MKKDRNVLRRYLEAKLLGKKIVINGISTYEIKRGFLSTGLTESQCAEKFRRFDNLVEDCDMVLFDEISIFETAAEMWARVPKGKRFSDNDILIASLARVQGLILVTGDSDFSIVEDTVDLQDWSNAYA
jgi:predicted nucleic acid-binding protein